MGQRNLTILEYHSHGDGPRVLPNLFDRESDEEGAEDGGMDADEGTDDGGRSMRPILAIVALLAIGAGIRYLRSSDDAAEFDEEQVEVTEYEQ